MKRKITNRSLRNSALYVAATILFALFYRHLRAQALSQGFVLQELQPLMDIAIALGKGLFLAGGSPLFSATILTALCALGLLLVGAAALPKATTATLAWPLVGTACLVMMSLGGTGSLVLYVLAMVAVPLLTWFVQRFDTDACVAKPAGISDHAIIAGIVLLGLVLRMYKLDVFPRLYLIDEQLLAEAALQIGERGRNFFEEPHIMKPHLLRLVSIYSAFSVLGVGLFQHRTVSALEGTACIVLVYLLCRHLWGNRAGICAAFALAIDPWHIGYSRFGIHEIEGPLFLLALLYLIVRAVRKGGTLNFALLGVIAGASVYLYLSCLIMAPFAWAAVIAGRFLTRKEGKPATRGEITALVFTTILVALPYFTLGLENIGELNDFYSKSAHFLAGARDRGWNPAFMLFVNFWRGVEYLLEWSPRETEVANRFYPNPMLMSFALMGLGVLCGMRTRFENVLVLAWIPIAFLPVGVSYGFADRRLFATLVPIPAMLAGLILARFLPPPTSSVPTKWLRLLMVPLLGALALSSVFITFEGTDPQGGGTPHPRKAAEFINSLPPQYDAIVSDRMQRHAYLLYLTNYERLKQRTRDRAFSFVSFEELAPLVLQVASTPGLAVLLEPGPEQGRFLEAVKEANPRVQIFLSDEYLACVVPMQE
ncbi:MAG: hypothetical protein Kow0099_28830 [Candidatus Abyssubacteria bacterium]